MPNQLQIHGAQPSRPTRFAPLYTSRFFDGIITQQSPFGGGGATHAEIAYLGPRNNKIIDGINVEVSSYLTAIRRPGLSVYNSKTFPPCNRMYENRVSIYNATQTQLNESIQVIYDSQDGRIFDATGPSTETIIFSKSAGAGPTSFQSVGNSLYFSDGPDQKKLITPSKIWAPTQSFSSGDLITDSNGNAQEVQPAPSLNISTVQVIAHSIVHIPPILNYYAIVTFSSNVNWPIGTQITFSGLTGYTALNRQTLTTLSPPGVTPTANQVVVNAPISAVYGPIVDTGSAAVGNSGSFTSGAIQPTWNVAIGGTTNDGSVIWRNFGIPIYDLADDAPTQGPKITPNPNNRQWTPLTTFPQNYTILDQNNNVQLAIVPAATPGVSGVKPPVWSTTTPSLGTNIGGATITIPGGSTQDGNITWVNVGTPISWVANTVLPNQQIVIDSNGNWQYSLSTGGAQFGTTGSTVPVWNVAMGGNTTDNTITWLNVGPGTVLITGNVQYAFSFHSIDGSVTTSSPVSFQNINSDVVGSSTAYRAILSGPNSVDPQIDQIWLWRTVQGGSTLFLLDTIQNPAVALSASWTYTDYLPDTSLDIQIEAPIADQNNPPPVGITALTYHVGRLWGAVGNIIYNSQGPDVVSGNGNTAWNPSDFYIVPSTVTRMDPTTYGLIIYTLSDAWLLQGLGTSSSGFFLTPFLSYMGLVSYDGFSKNGGITFLYTSDNQLVTLDPNGGVSEIGFPIGDQFGPKNGTKTFTPATTKVTWHISGSEDKGLYVSDSAGAWWRLCPTPSPETGMTWSPRAEINGGFSCVQSVETSPGTHDLLVAPRFPGPILKRDSSVYTDNGNATQAYFILGSLVLAQPGQVAIVESITIDARLVGNPPTLAVQLDEIAPLSAGFFEPLTLSVPDPPTLEPPNSLYAQRFYLSQTQDPAWCRHMQIQVNWGTDSFRNELLSLSVYGGFESEK